MRALMLVGLVPALAVPSVTVAPLAGDVVEEVRFLRDELANLVWGVEQIVTDPDGTRRDLPDEYVRALVRADAIPPNADVAYQLMTDVPDHWVPFIPVHIAGSSRRSGDRVAAIERPAGAARSGTAGRRSPVGRHRRATAMVPRAID